ncbi:glycosyltransferase [Vibrio splendidus]
MKKHILINSLSGGGAERVVSSLVNFNPEKYSLISIWPDQDYELCNNVEYTVLIEKRKNILIDLFFAVFNLISLIRERKITSINSHLFWANYVNLFCSIYTKHQTYCTHCVSFFSKYKKGNLNYYIHYFLCRHLLSRATGHTFKCNDLMVSYKKIFEFSNCSVIYNPIDNKKHDIRGVDFSFIDGCNYILCVGRFHETKNQESIIRSLEFLSNDINIIFLGDGPKLKHCKEISKELGFYHRTHFLGYCNNPSYFYNRVPYIISSSLSEGFPNVMIEAISYNCFPISYDCETGPREVSSVLYSCKGESYKRFDVYPLGVIFNSPDCFTISEAIKFSLENKLYVNKSKSNFMSEILDIEFISRSYSKLGEFS